MRKLILRNFQPPGDLVVLTGAVRDLHKSHPGEFLTDVRTTCPQLWESNPHLTRLDDKAKDVEVIECQYPLIHQSNILPHHFIEAFHEFLADKLGVPLRPTAFKGDIHLSPREKSWASQVREVVGRDLPYWIIVAGGKKDFTIKWWAQERFQQVVDHFRDKIAFVQVGDRNHVHPALEGVLDMRGKTDLRQLVRLVYHSQGVFCPVTLHMHLAAAVPVKAVERGQAADGRNAQPATMSLKPGGLRPCVVVAGGREPAQWEAYPGHQFLQTIGALPCCEAGGCWKSRTKPVGDGDAKDKPENVCLDVINGLPHCMHMIKAADVVQRIELYFEGHQCQFLTPEQAKLFRTKASRQSGVCAPVSRSPAVQRPAVVAPPPQDHPENNGLLTIKTARVEMDKFIAKTPPYPGGQAGRGIVICGGGEKYFPSAWVCINMLRRFGNKLPIQLWHLGPGEMDDQMRGLLQPLGVECVDAYEVRKQCPARILNGWEVKPYSIIHSPFQEVLFLDADNVPVADPEYLFESPEYKAVGAVFWPDYGELKAPRQVWEFCGIPHRDERDFESGQILLHKERSWNPLQLALWMNEHSDFFYRHIHGDKETFHLAWRKWGQDYAMPRKAIHPLAWTMCQHDFSGHRIFQHRNLNKWSLVKNNPAIPGFRHEKECREHLMELARVWHGTIQSVRQSAAGG